MKARAERRIDGFSAAQLFDVAADFPAYPRFLPLCRAMRTAAPMRCDAAGRERVKVDNVFGLSGVRVRFISEATFDPPGAITIVSNDGPFERLDIAWRFDDAGARACYVVFETEFRMRAGILEKLATAFANGLERKIIDAFALEAGRRYGAQSSRIDK